MLVNLLLIILVMIGFFSVSLLVSYEGFQIIPNLRTQQMSPEDVNSICKKMESILLSNDMSYEQMIRMLHAEKLTINLSTKDIDVIELNDTVN